MARKKTTNPYRTVGSAAVDPAWGDSWESTARPLPEFEPQRVPKPQRQPQRQPQRAPKKAPQKAPATRGQMQVAPLGVVGVAISGLMLVLVIFGYSQVYTSACRVGQLREQVQQLQEENQSLQNRYDTSIDLEQIEIRARELGMQQPSSKQLVSLRIPTEDVTVISGSTTSNFFKSAWDAVLETARSLWEYLR